MERQCVLLGYDRIEPANRGGANSRLIHVGTTMEPDLVKVTKATYEWVEPATNTVE